MIVPPRPLWRRALPAAGLVAFAAFASFALPVGIRNAAAGLASGVRQRGDDAREALVRLRGAAYADALDRIRAAIPEDGEYLLLENDEARDAVRAVRVDLAPRRAVVGGRTGDVRRNVTVDALPKLPRWTVIPAIAEPGPRLVETRALAETGRLP